MANAVSATIYTILCLGLLLLAVTNADEESESFDLQRGHSSCPCLASRHEIPTIDVRDRTETLNSTVGYQVIALESNQTDHHHNNQTSGVYYGVNCFPHDLDTPQCDSDSNNNPTIDAKCRNSANVVPPLLGCDLSWCRRRWCFVDPANCTLSHRRHPNFLASDRYYSYATCGDMDAFTSHRRFAALEDKRFKMGLNSNTGGWLGSYRRDGRHFAGPLQEWSGLALNYVVQAAYRGNFQLEVTEPPEFLRNRSRDFFDSASPFDWCVYATSLGYLDLCVAQYTITDQRASSTDWLLLGSSGIYLIVDTSAASVSNVEFFFRSVTTIFQPFTPQAWAFIVFFVIPLLGCLMIVHERGKGGSTYPTEEAVVVIDETKGESVLQKRPVPLHRTLIKSIYIAFLAVLQQSYEQSVLTLGAMLNLLGISFFILTIIAVYTANLAAILTQNVQISKIDSLDDAVRAGYRICAERKNMETIMNVYPNLDPTIFAVDPLHLGGDGKPGFTCADCHSRMRVFDFLDPIRADAGDPRYCHAAIAPMEDVDVVHAASLHCNKTAIGKPLQMIQTGMPVFHAVSPELISYFLKLKNDGLYDSTVAVNRPESQCPLSTSLGGTEGSALGLAQLSGIWVVSFAFAMAGLVATGIQKWHSEKKSKRTFRVKQVHKRDQKGGRIDALGIEDSWMTAANGSVNSIESNHRPGLIHEGSKAGSIRLMDGSDLHQRLSRRNVTKDATDVSRKNLLPWSRKDRNSISRQSKESSSTAKSETPMSQLEPTPEDSLGSTSESSKASALQSIASVTESRERLLRFIDRQAAQEVDTNANTGDPIINQSLGEGSIELQYALDELAFTSSFRDP